MLTRRLPSTFVCRVVGVTFAEGYPLTIYRLDEMTSAGEFPPVRLMRDPHNPHDANAIKVICVAAGGHIGHIPRHLAARLAPAIDAGETWEAQITDCAIHPQHPDNPGIQLSLRRAS